MTILDRILGRPTSETPQVRTAGKPAQVTEMPASAVSPPASADGAREQGVVRVYDQYGRTVMIGRETWRRDVLLPNLAANRGNPDALYDLIASAVNDDFAHEVLEPARWLALHDPDARRGARTLAVVLLQVGDFAAAREVLEGALARHGEDAHLLSNLARALAALGEEERARELMWRALALDPNDAASLNWLIARENARGGGVAVLAAYARAAALAGSWRALLWLARDALERGDVDAATTMYEEALARARPLPADLLMQLSGDLGNRGHAELLVRLTQPRFDVVVHGLAVGNNLLRAFIDLGRFAEARSLLERLYSLQRPDWRESLNRWEQQLDDAQHRHGEYGAPLDIVMLRLEQPVWAHGVLGFDRLLPAKTGTAPSVHFISGSAQSGDGDADAASIISRPTGDLGRLSRALPMFLAEELFLRTAARAVFVLPWMKQGGFVLSAHPWSSASLPEDESPPDLRVFLHVDARVSPWHVSVRIEPARGHALRIIERAFTPATSADDVMSLLGEVISQIAGQLRVGSEAQHPALATPELPQLPAYLAGIEQALVIGLAARQPEAASILHQERAIFDHLMDVALQGAGQLRPRLLLVNALENQARRRPDITREYLGRVQLLQRQYPLPGGPEAELVGQAVQTLATRIGGQP